MKRETIVDDFTLNDLKEYLAYKFSDKKNNTYKQAMIENNELLNDKNANLYYISNIRQYVPFFRGMDNESHDIVPSIKRLYGNPQYYTISKESNYIKGFIKSPFINEKDDKKISINLLARMQHYNYKSRLIDITFNIAVAIYMASYTDYLSNGKIIEFVHSSIKKAGQYANKLDRFHFISNPSQNLSDNLKYMNYLVNLDKKPKLKPNYESNPVVVIDRQTFKHNTAAYDLRYDAQEGAFIMFMNEIDVSNSQNLKDLDCKDLISSNLSYRRISSVNKLAFLFLLAQHGVTHATMYPDKDLIHEIKKIIVKIGCLNKKTDILNSFDNSLSEYLNFSRFSNVLSTTDRSNVKKLSHFYINKPSILEFLLTDYLMILKDREFIIKRNISHEISTFNNAVKILITESNNQDFGYLII